VTVTMHCHFCAEPYEAHRPGLPIYLCPKCALIRLARLNRVEMFHNRDGWYFMEAGDPEDGPSWNILQLGSHTFETPFRTKRLRYLGMYRYVPQGAAPTILYTRVGDAPET
jgi:hypothetical protein